MVFNLLGASKNSIIHMTALYTKNIMTRIDEYNQTDLKCLRPLIRN